ncbi:hypothetical protein HYALB_00004354 [Hymenoscyphus albidus]|uniref:DUF1479-domain-containing protein n=1 Tax=Hymenoscyphus albidus TaxID=595503 RepID=A0A9N9M153_9HELO|nr:hypothetical protein HYALB_00004354 [Hymenoscyphus albidus]
MRLLCRTWLTSKLQATPQVLRLQYTGMAGPPRKEGDISSVFVSLSGVAPTPLPHRFIDLKKELTEGHEEALTASWGRLLKAIDAEVKYIFSRGSSVIPSIEFSELDNNPAEFRAELRKRGVGVVRNVVPSKEARAYKDEIEAYVKANPSTKGFPKDDPCVFELYWSPAQVKARAHPNLLQAQSLLMNTWHSKKDSKAPISMTTPLSYADRVRIRQPGDTGFALGPHIDGGSVERWEKNGYGKSGVYDSIFAGDWESYDPWESSCRLEAVTDLYQGAGACTMFRMFQGWLSMSNTKPGEGTLQVNPMIKLTTAYTLLRPFFRAITPFEIDVSGAPSQKYLDASNWAFEPAYNSEIQGAALGNSQELNTELHPHLHLSQSMVHVPEINPGDYVVWHCDAIHAVDKVHAGKSDSSVLYIPCCPLTEKNAEYLELQRIAFLTGTPGPDFPGGIGESEHVGRPKVADLMKSSETIGLQAMGLEYFDFSEGASVGERKVFRRANEILGFGV